VPAEPGPRKGGWRAACVVALTAGLCYANALSNEFALDDNDVIARNPLVHHIAGVFRAFFHTYWPESTRAGQYRPLTIGSFALDWALSRGAPVWLHAVNVLWHVAACILVWRLLLTILSKRGALAGALLFAVHPVHVEAVANLVGRSELMCTAFVLAALLAHRRRHWSAVPLYAAALMSKETGITFLGLAVAADVLLSTAPDVTDSVELRRHGAMAGIRRRAALYVSYAGVTAGYWALLTVLFRGIPLVRVAAPWMHISIGARWLTAISVVPEYARLLLIPLRLHVDYSPLLIEVAHGVTASVVIGAAVVVGAVIMAVRSRKTNPPLAFAVALFVATIAPVSNIVFASGIILAERTLYLPSVAIAIMAGWAWERAAIQVARPWWGTPQNALGTVPAAARDWFLRPVLLGLAAIVLVTFAARTWTRTPVWRNNKSAIVASLRGEPDAYRAHERAADVLEREGSTAAALHEYAMARMLYPGDPYLYQAAASILVSHGDSGMPAAERLLDSARLIDPSPYADVMRHAWLRYAAGDYHGTVALAHTAYLMQRDSVDAIMVLTQAAQQIDDVGDATTAFQLALADHPRDRPLRRSYAAMLMSIGDSAGAARQGRLADAGAY
jgi:hypothetical protein